VLRSGERVVANHLADQPHNPPSCPSPTERARIVEPTTFQEPDQ
jgi:hypothetical protein